MADAQDIIIECKNTLRDGGVCGVKFAWTVKGQNFFKERGYQPPKYCRECRREREEARRSYDQNTSRT